MTTKKGFTHPNPVFSETSPGFICFSPGTRWPRLPACQSTGPRACADIVLSRSPAPVTAPGLLRAVRCGGSSSFISSPTMTITYSCIANGRAVLAELALTGGSYQVPLRRLLSLRPSQIPPFEGGAHRTRSRAVPTGLRGVRPRPRERPSWWAVNPWREPLTLSGGRAASAPPRG